MSDHSTVTIVVPSPGVTEPEMMNSLGSFVNVADAASPVAGPGTETLSSAVASDGSSSTTA